MGLHNVCLLRMEIVMCNLTQSPQNEIIFFEFENIGNKLSAKSFAQGASKWRSHRCVFIITD